MNIYWIILRMLKEMCIDRNVPYSYHIEHKAKLVAWPEVYYITTCILIEHRSHLITNLLKLDPNESVIVKFYASLCQTTIFVHRIMLNCNLPGHELDWSGAIGIVPPGQQGSCFFSTIAGDSKAIYWFYNGEIVR